MQVNWKFKNAFLSCVSFKYQLCPKKSYDTNETNAYVQEYTLKERKKCI